MEVTMIMTIVMTMMMIGSLNDNNKDNWQMMTIIVFMTIGKAMFLQTSESDLQSLISMHMTMLSG